MTVIAMTHEIGTFGQQIASKLAVRLGLDYADQSFLEERIADRLASDKRGSEFGCRHLKAFRGNFEVDNRALARAARDEIAELAAYGNVLLRGWGAAALLRNNRDVLRIRVHAPMPFRCSVLTARGAKADHSSLQRFIEHSDACIASNMEPILGSDWSSSEYYQITLDSQARSVEDNVEHLIREIETLKHRKVVFRRILSH